MGGDGKFTNLKTFAKVQPAGASCCSLPPHLNLTKFLQPGNGCANSLISRGSDVIGHRKMGPNPSDVSDIIEHIWQERRRHQTGVGSHCKTRPERHKVLLISEVFFLAFVISDIAFLIVSTKLWKQKVVSICSIACIQHLSVKVDFHENFSRFFYQKKKFQLPQYVPYSLPGFSQPHNEYH